MSSKKDLSTRYERVPASESDSELGFDALQRSVPRHRSRVPWKTLCISGTLVNLALLVFFVFGSRYTLYIGRLDQVPSDLAEPIFEPKTEYRKLWNHDASQNYTENEKFWGSLLPGHGLVAVDRDWAADRGWAESVYLPSDHSKGVYALEAYHQLHCLRTIRATFWEAHDKKEITWPNYHEHMEHCFEGLRQNIMCTADHTALFTFGGDTIGHGQLRKCHSWDQLRDWATENAACYNVSPANVPLRDRFDACDNGFDGMVYRS